MNYVSHAWMTFINVVKGIFEIIIVIGFWVALCAMYGALGYMWSKELSKMIPSLFEFDFVLVASSNIENYVQKTLALILCLVSCLITIVTGTTFHHKVLGLQNAPRLYLTILGISTFYGVPIWLEGVWWSFALAIALALTVPPYIYGVLKTRFVNIS